MTREEREEAIKIIEVIEQRYVTLDNDERKALVMAIKALERESCEDAISRQAAIDAFERFIHELGIKDEPYNYGEMALSVKNVPPVKQELVLDDIREEIESCREDEVPHLCDYRKHRNEGLDMALDIIDKYKAEENEDEE